MNEAESKRKRGPYGKNSRWTKWRKKIRSDEGNVGGSSNGIDNMNRDPLLDNSNMHRREQDIILETETQDTVIDCDKCDIDCDCMLNVEKDNINEDGDLSLEDSFADDKFIEVEEEDADSYSKKQTEEALDNEYLYYGSRLTIGASMLLVMTFVLQHGLTAEALKDLLILIEVHCALPNIFRKTIKVFNDFFKEMRCPVAMHYVCKFCYAYLGTEKKANCIKCDNSDLCYFLAMPIVGQLLRVFEGLGKNVLQQLRYPSTRIKRNDSAIEDVFDGHLYKSVFENGYLRGFTNDCNEIHISLQFNTDGVQLFRSSNFSIWPVYLTINELDPKIRYRNQNRLFVGLWFGYNKPVMDAFLKPFVEELKQLYEKGEVVVIENQKYILRAVLLSAVCDAPARACIQNLTQFNGYYGCSTCYEKGSSFKTAKGGSTTTYPYNVDDKFKYEGHCELRSHEETVNLAKEAIEKKSSVYGVKGPCELLRLPGFDIIRSVTIDYMHCVILGVQKMMLHLWFDTSNKDNSFYIGQYANIFNERICSISPPHFVSRSPRCLKDLSNWKASELKMFLLYYSIPCLYGILPSELYNHFLCLNQAVFILLQMSISKTELKLAKKLIVKFCASIDFLYGGRHESSNVHALLHLSQKVEDLGPLWAHSCFYYEDYNHYLHKMFHGTQQVAKQILTAVVIQQTLPCLESKIQPYTEVHEILRNMTQKFSSQRIVINETSNFLGFSEICSISEEMCQCLSLKKDSINSCLRYFKLVKDGIVFFAKEHSRTSARISYVARVSNQTDFRFCELLYFLKIDQGNFNKNIAVIKMLKDNTSLQPLPFYMTFVHHVEKITYINIKDLVEICILINLDGKLLVGTFPNTIEKE